MAEVEAEAEAAAQEALGSAAPAAQEPLSPAAVGTLRDAVGAAAAFLSDNQVSAKDMPEPPPPDTDGGYSALPAEVFAPLSALGSALAQMGGGELQFMELATTNDGLAQLAGDVSALVGDEELKARLAQAPTDEPTEEGPAEPGPAEPKKKRSLADLEE